MFLFCEGEAELESPVQAGLAAPSSSATMTAVMDDGPLPLQHLTSSSHLKGKEVLLASSI